MLLAALSHLFCLPGNQPTTQTSQAGREKQKHVDDRKNATYICGVIGPSTCSDHNVFGSQDRLYEGEGKCEVIAFVRILQKTRKCQMKVSSLYSILHSGDDGNTSLKQVTALSV